MIFYIDNTLIIEHNNIKQKRKDAKWRRVVIMKKEMVKAIRIVNGFNSDLRVKLNTINRNALWDWIDCNRFGIFGYDFGTSKPDATSDEWQAYERTIWRAVDQVVNGCCED